MLPILRFGRPPQGHEHSGEARCAGRNRSISSVGPLRKPALPTCILAVACFLGATGLLAVPRAAAAQPRAIVQLIGDLNTASGVVYNARSVEGLPLDALKVIQAPRPGRYLGVFDSVGPGNSFVTRLAVSDHLAYWHAGPILSLHGSMPTITYVDGGYLVAFELAAPNGDSQIELEHFAGLRQLMAARPDREIALPRILSRYNEGTPTIESVELHGRLASSRIAIGFHYNVGHGVDRNGIGLLVNFAVWTERPNVELDAAIEHTGVHGSIGDRDAVKIDGVPLELVGGQQDKHDWSSWGLYAVPVPVTTPRGSGLSIGVIRCTIVRDAHGTRILVMSAFVYQEGSPPGTPGELVWWRGLR